MDKLTEFSFWGSDIDLEENFVMNLSYDKIPVDSSPERIKKGIVCVFLQGNAHIQVDGVKHIMEEGMILSVFPHQLIEQKSVSSDFKQMYFTCSEEMLNRILFRFPPAFEFFLKEYPTYKLPVKVFEYYKRLFALLYEKYVDKESVVRNELILSLLRSFYLEIYNKVHQRITLTPGKQIRKHEVFRDLINLLVTNARKHREVQYYAERLNITPKYLSVVTGDIIGQSAKKVIDNFILMEVKLELRVTDNTIQEISDSFNFPDHAFFCKFFKKQTGLTPKQYRDT